MKRRKHTTAEEGGLAQPDAAVCSDRRRGGPGGPSTHIGCVLWFAIHTKSKHRPGHPVGTRKRERAWSYDWHLFDRNESK